MDYRISREKITLPMQREIRQRCGFGCVICGLPLYEYEHMLGYAKIQRHVTEEITLLCNQHHRERTSELLPIDVVIAADKNPHNLKEGVSKPYDSHYSGDECEVVVGKNKFITNDAGNGVTMTVISIDDMPLLRFSLENGHLLLTLNVFNEFNQFVLQIIDNELVYSISPWDIQLVGRNLVIREGQGKFLIDIIFEVPNKITINRGRFLCNGVELFVDKDQILDVNNTNSYSGNIIYSGGLVIGRTSQQQQSGFIIPNIKRYLGDRTESLKKAKQMFPD